MFQAFNQLEIATHVEMVASLLCRDACRLIKTTLAGLAAGKVVDIVEAAFGGEETAATREAMEEVLAEDEGEAEVAETEEATPSSSKRKASTPAAGLSKRKVHSSKGGSLSLSDAQAYYPTVSDRKQWHHAGVNPQFFSKRKSSSTSKSAGYGCLYSEVLKAEGKIVPDCDFFSSVKGQLSTHIRQFHLGIAVTCFICSKRWWSAATWREHMERQHSSLKEEDYFLKEGAEEELEEFCKFTIKKEVDADEV